MLPTGTRVKLTKDLGENKEGEKGTIMKRDLDMNLYYICLDRETEVGDFLPWVITEDSVEIHND